MMLFSLLPLLLQQPSALEGPCDVFAKGGTPCVAAHSVVRAMFAAYDGPLYSVRRLSADLQPENRTYDIKPLSPGGIADAAAQDKYCTAGSSAGCTIAVIYDQSPFGNHLRAAPARRGSIDLEVNASVDPLLLGGKRVYSAYFQPVADYPNATGGREHATAVGVGYRNDNTTGVAKGDEPETLYMVTSGQHYNAGCCFDYGNAEDFLGDAGDGTMEAISITNDTRGTMHGASHGVGPGPWIWGDLEQGLFVGNKSWPAPSLRDAENNTIPFVTAMIKGDSASTENPLGHWAIKGFVSSRFISMLIRGDATASGGLRTLFDGPRPCAGTPPACLNKGNQSWSPMRKFGGIILGIGGDNSYAPNRRAVATSARCMVLADTIMRLAAALRFSHGGVGTFYEGALTSGYSTDETDAALQENIVAAKYAKLSD